jgi:hypothetical protein
VTSIAEAARRLALSGGPVSAGRRDFETADAPETVAEATAGGEYLAIVPEDHDRLHQETRIVLSDVAVDLEDVR